MARDIDLEPKRLKQVNVQIDASLFKSALERAREREIISVRELFETLLKAYLNEDN